MANATLKRFYLDGLRLRIFLVHNLFIRTVLVRAFCKQENYFHSITDKRICHQDLIKM